MKLRASSVPAAAWSQSERPHGAFAGFVHRALFAESSQEEDLNTEQRAFPVLSPTVGLSLGP